MKAGNVKWVRLGDYISQRRENNSSLKYGIDLIEGVNSNGEFQPTKALTDNINLKPYKVVRHGDIVYNPSWTGCADRPAWTARAGVSISWLTRCSGREL